MDDLISRQQAIDALGGNEPVGDPSKMDDDDVVKMWERIRIINIINKLPSIQPDVIRCKDCRFQDKGRNESESWNLCGYRPWLHVPTEDEHYCGYAERRTDE